MPRRRHASACGTHHRARRWLSTDCCGWVCAILTWFFLGWASYAVYYGILKPWKGDPFSVDNPPNFNGWFHYIGFFGCIFLSYWSHLKTMLTDPGAVPMEAVPLDYYNEPPHTGRFQQHHEICRHCDAYKPRTAHHCSICERCVVRMDHHCVWSNNCIGQTNHKFFVLFIFYVFIACSWATYLLFAKIIVCGRGYKQDAITQKFYQSLEFCASGTVGSSMMSVFLGLEAFFFGIFTLCMMCDQYSVVYSGASHIDELKAKKQRKDVNRSTFRDSLQHIFGGDGFFSPWWFIPVDSKWNNPEKEFAFMLPSKSTVRPVGGGSPSVEDADKAGGDNRSSDDPQSVMAGRGVKAPDEMV